MTKGDSSSPLDVERIMESIRERVARKKASGAYSEKEVTEIAAMELSLQEQEGYGEEMDRILSWLHAHWEATGEVDPEGAAAGSPAREAVKKALRKALSPAARLLLGKQNQINAKMVQLLSGTLPPLREGFLDIDQRGDAAALRLEKENRDLRRELEELASRLERLEGKEGGPPGEAPGER